MAGASTGMMKLAKNILSQKPIKKMDKETTPRAYAAWKASIDDTGCVCRMGPIWDTMSQLEIELEALQRRLELAMEVASMASADKKTPPKKTTL